MAIVNSIIFGGLSGKLGGLVYFQRNGKTYVRKVGVRRKKLTPAQLVQQAKFKLAASFVKALHPLLKITYAKAHKLKTGANLVLADVLQKAIVGSFPSFSIDYSRLSVSKGNKIFGQDGIVTSTTPGLIQFTWQYAPQFVGAHHRSILVAYCAADNRCIFSLHGDRREAGETTLDVQPFSRKLVHTWLAFIDDAGNVSDSRYAGAVLVM